MRVHNNASKLVELLDVLHRLSEEVGGVVVRRDVRHLKFELFDHVAHKEVATLHVLGLLVVLRVVRGVARALAVAEELRRARLRVAEAGDGALDKPPHDGALRLL